MATLVKEKDLIRVDTRGLPSQVVVRHNAPGESYAGFTFNAVNVDSKRIKSMIEEAESLAACLKRILPAQVAAENKLKPKKKNPYAKHSPYSKKKAKV